MRVPGPERIHYVADAFRQGMSVDEVYQHSRIDPWFLCQIADLVDVEARVHAGGHPGLTNEVLRKLKRQGFSDARIAHLVGIDEEDVRDLRHRNSIRPVYKRVDSCAAEFAWSTAYMYATYESECEAAPVSREKIIVLGGGPNRIGQGIEFDYCCVQAVLALRDLGYQTIMVNCNPETVSTDYDTADRLYFEPITLEDATGVPLARIAAACMVGRKLVEQGAIKEPKPKHFSVKEAVFPFVKFPGVDPLLGPEMKSTGDMGVGTTFGEAFLKAQQAAGVDLPRSGKAFVSMRDEDKPSAVAVARALWLLDFQIVATQGTQKVLSDAGIPCVRVNKVIEGQPHIVDMIKNDEIDLIINTTQGRQAIADSYTIRATALEHKVAYTTTLAGAQAMVLAIEHGNRQGVICLQDMD